MQVWRRSRAHRDQGDFARLRPARNALAFAVSAAFAASASSAFANPSGASITRGGVTFAVNGNTLTITNTPGAIINWQQFSIARDEITRFIQQHAASTVLNRVTGQNPSLILGQLTSNGRVFLINPSGIAFGQGAIVDVAGLAASTLNISDADFVSGRMRFTGTGAEGKLTNAGTIRTAEGGHVYLIAPNVENQKSGVITSPKGEVVIAAGKTVELVNSRTPDLRVEFAAPDNQAVNAGEIVAASGSVGIYGTLIKNSGRVSASRAEVGDGGKIVFRATKDVTLESTSVVDANGAKGGAITVETDRGTTLVSGTVEAKGEAGKGGEIQILGRHVGLVDNALVDASGELGGGTVLVGGDFQGKNAGVQNAEKTYVGRDTVIRADAVTSGDGGKVIVWSDDTTRFYGSLSARGGRDGGNGGFAEISGKLYLDASIARVDLGAPKGTVGMLLLDPQDIVINGSSVAPGDGDDNGAATGLLQEPPGTPGEILFADTPPGVFNIHESEIEGSNANITLQATNSITVAGTFGADTNGEGTGAIVRLKNDRSLTLDTRNATGDGAGATQPAGINLGGVTFQTQGTGAITIRTGVTGTGAGGETADISLGGLGALGTGTISVQAANGSIAANGAISNTSSVSLTSSAGAISQSVATGSITTGGLTTSSAGGTVLNGANAVSSFSATNTPNGAVALTNTASTLTVTGVSQGDGGVAITNAGNLTVAGAVTAASTGAISLTASGLGSNVQLDSNLTSGSGTVAVTAANNVVIGDGVTVSTTGGVNLTATAGQILESGFGTAGKVVASALTTISALGQTLSGANQVGAFNATNTSSGAITLSNTASTLNVTSVSQSSSAGVSITNTGELNIGSITSGGTVALSAGGAITDGNGASTNVTAGNLTAIAAGGIALDTAVLDISATNTTAGDVVLSNTNAAGLFITGSNTASGGGFLVTETSGSLSVVLGGLTTQRGTVSLTSAGAVTLNDAIATLGGDVIIDAATSVTGNSTITTTAGVNTGFKSGDVTITAINSIALNDTLDVRGADHNAGPGSQAGAVSLTTGGGNLTVNGDILASGGAATAGIDDGGVGGGINLNADFGQIDVFGVLDARGGSSSGGTMGQGGAIRINDTAPTPWVVNLFDAVMTNGNDIEITGLTVTQGALASISTTGAGEVSITSTVGNITLNGTASLGSGQLTIDAANALNLNNTIATQGGDVVITAGQDITAISAAAIATTAAVDSGFQSGDVSITSAAGDIVLHSSITTTGATHASVTGSAAGAISVTANSGFISLVTGGGLFAQGGAATAGTNDGGTGGAISLNAVNGSVEVPVAVNASGGAGFGGGGTGAGGAIRINDTSSAPFIVNVHGSGSLTTNDAPIDIRGVGVMLQGSITNAGTGTILVNAGTGTLTNEGTISNSGGAGAITLAGDRMALETGSVAGGSGIVTLRQSTNNRSIDVGTVGDTGSLVELSEAELNTISTSGTLRVGDSNTQFLNLTDSVEVTSATTLRLQASGSVWSNTHTITADRLALVSGGGGIDIVAATSDLAASTPGGGISVLNTTAGGTLNVTGVDGIAGLLAGTSAVTLTELTGNVTLSQAVSGTTVAITLDGNDKLLTNSSTIIAAGAVTLRADALTITGTVTGTSVTLRPNDLTAVIGVEDGAQAFNVTDVMLGQITTAGTVTVGAIDHTGEISAAGDNAILTAKSLVLVTDGSINFVAPVATAGDISAAALTLTAGANGNTTTAAITRHAAHTGRLITTTGDLSLSAANGIGALLTPILIGDVAGSLSATNTSSNALALDIATDTLNVGGGSGISQFAGGSIRLDQTAAVAGTGTMTIVGNISAGPGGTIILNPDGVLVDGTAGTAAAGTITAGTVRLGIDGRATQIGASGDAIATAATTLLDARSTGAAGGVFLSNTGDVNVTAQVTGGTGAINIANAGTLATAAGGITSAGGGVTVVSNGDMTIGHAVTAGGTGTISLTVNLAGGTLTHTAGALDGNNQLITLTADKMDLAGGTIGSAAGDTVVLKSLTAGNLIDLGALTDGTANTLELSNAEIGTVQAGTLRIGEAVAGAIAFSDDITPHVNVTAVHLLTGAGVDATLGGLTGGVNLAINAGGAVSFTDTGTDVGTLAVSNAGNSVTFVDANGLVVGDVGSVQGVSGTNVALTATTGDLTVNNGAAAADINASGTVALTTLGGGGLLTIAGGSNVTGTSGAHTYTADRMAIAGTITASGQIVGMQNASSGRLIDLGAIGDATANTLELSSAELNNVTAGTLRIGRNDSNASGNVLISQAIAPAGTTTLHIRTGGAVSQADTITETNLAISAADLVNLGLANDVTNLAAVLTGTGDAFQFTDASAVSIGTVDGVSGIATNGGNVTVNAATGIASTASGAISTVRGANSGAASGNVTLNVSGTGNVTLLAGVVTAGAANNAGTGSGGGSVTIAVADGLVNVTSVDARGGAATTVANDGGQGGTISISAGNGGDVTIGAGGLLASGGAGFGGGLQGDGGNIHVNPLTPTPGAVVLDGPLTTNVGDVFVRGSSVVQAASAPISTSGAGNVTISAETLATVLNATVSAGYGAVQIGANTDIDINAAITSAGGDVLVSANGNITSASAGTITTTAMLANGLRPSGSVTVQSTAAGDVTLDGAIDTKGAANASGTGFAGGPVTITAFDGAVSVAGVDARGGAATTVANNGGQGGLISISAGDGDNLTVGTGGLLASGGAGFGGGLQGDGGNIHVNPLTPTPGAVVLDGPLTTNVGDVFVRGSSVVQAASAPISTSGAGNVTISAETLATVLNATVSGGYGAVQIGANTDIDINAAITSAGGDVLVSANGNITSTSAGTITTTATLANGLRPSGSVTVQSVVSGDVTLDGAIDARGAGNAAGAAFAGGNVSVSTFDGSIDVTGIDARGGAATGLAGNGGAGGTVQISGGSAAAGRTIVAAGIDASGGTSANATGGDGGAVSVLAVNNGAAPGTVTLSTLAMVGGNGATAGGNAGALTLAAPGGVTLGGNIIATGGSGTAAGNGANLSFTGPVTLGGNVILDANKGSGTGGTHGSISFVGTTSTVNGAFTLAANTGGTTTFGGAVGGTTALAGLSTDAGGTTAINGGVVNTVAATGDQSFGDAVTLGSNTTFSGHDITFTGALNSDAPGTPRTLTVNSNNSGTTTFGGAVGAGAALASITTNADGTTVINGGTVMTVALTGDQTFNDAVVLGADTIFSGNDITFAAAVNSDSAATPRALTVNSNNTGLTIFGGAVGATAELASVTTNADGTTDINGPAINTVAATGNQTFNDLVVLSLDTTLSGHDITFAQTVNSDGTARVLTVNSNNTGTTTFGGAVGGTSALAALTTNADGTTRINGGSVATAVTGGNQTFNDWVVLGADTTFSGRNIAFNSTLDSDSAATPRSVVVNSNNSGTTTFGGAVGASAILASVTTNADGTTVISGGVINTVAATGDQTFNDVAVVLGADTTLSGNDITFVGTIESASTARALTVNSGNNGTTTFGGSVGTAGPLLASITTNADGTTRINGGSMRTVTADGDQIFNDAVVLGANTTFSGNDITFAGTLNSDSAGTPRLATVNSNNSGVTTFGLAVGGTFALQALTTNADGTTHINGGSVTTVAVGGDQTFNDPVVLGADTTFSGHSITFVTTLDSDSAATPRSVLVNSNNNGTTTFGAAAGGNALLASVTTNADGTTRIAGSVTTVAASGDQTYNDVVALGADVTLSGNDITFASTIESDTTARALTVNSNNSGITTFTGSVGTPGLALASLTTNADGETRINGGAVRTTGDQAYDDVVVLGANTILTGNDIAFATTVNSDSAVAPRTLTVNSSGGGVTTFGGAVGGTFALQTLTTNADGTTRVNGGSVTTVFDQAFNDAVVLGADTTFSGHSINFAGTLNSDTAGTPRALVVNSSGGGTTTFGGAVGASAELASVTTNADGATVISGGAINTVAATGDQIFNDAVVLGAADATLSGNDITFNGTIESGGTARALTVNSNNNGVTTFQGTVGLPELASLTTNADGTTIINGGLVRTSGAQTYGDAVTLGANTQLTTTAAGGNGNISATTITGAGAGGQNLTFMAGTGDITVSGDVGGTRLGVLTVTSGDVVQFQGTGTQQAASLTVTTSTSTTFTGKVDLTSGVALAGTAGNVSFLDGLNTGAASSFANIGTLQIGDNLGDMSSIHTSLVHTAGPTVLAGTIASPTMTFGVTTLLDDTVLNATNNVNFNNALSGQHSLTISTAGATTFSDVVGGGGNALTTLSVTSGAGIAINGGAITTSGAQAYNNDATFDSATTLTSSADGITFGGSLTGPVAFADLTVGAGAGDFSVTGALTRVSNLSVTSAANVTFTGAVSAASNVDVTNTGDLTFTGALNAANLDITTAGNVSAVNVANAISGTTTFTVGGNVGYKEAGSILLGAATIGGLATIEARNGGITTTGLFQADDGMTLAAHDTSGGNNGTISVGAGGLQSSNAPIRLHAADDITVNGPINSNGGNIQFVSGDANGINYASPLLAPFLVGRESAQDEFGALTINAVVNAGTGQIMVVAAGDAGTGPSFADVNQGPAGALRSSLLSVVTLKGPGGLGNPGANITLDNLPPDTMNTNSTVRLFTCAWLGCPDPLPAPPLPPVKTLSPSLISYSGGNIRYTDSSGVNLAGLGTVADFYLFTSGSFTLTPNPFSAGSVFVEASDDIVIDLGQPLLKISNDPNASLNFIAGRDIWYVNPSYSGKGYTIGTPGTPFANHLNFTAVRSIVLNNSLYQDAAHNLTIAANAEIHTPFQDKLPSGAGHVTLLGSYQVQTGGNATISGIDFSLLGYGNVRPGSLPTDAPVLNDSFSDAADGWQAIARPLLEPAQVPNPYGQELIAGGTITLANTGVITVRGGTTTGSAANPMGNGARLQGGTVNIGQAGGANNPTQLVIQGGTNIVGYATSDSSDPNLLRRQANAMVVANGDMNVYLRSAPLDAVTDGVPFDGSYSMIIRGGTATASNSGATPLVVSALGVLQASQLTMETDGTILFQGGTATLRTANAAAASSALLLVSDNKTITTSGSMVLIGGIANVNTTDAVSGQPLTSTEAANAQAMARLDPSNLTLEVDGILVMQGGKTTGPAGSFASARIDAGNEIKITVNGSAPYEYISSAGVPTAVGPASFYMIGGSDSGFFDKNNVDLAGSLSYPQAFPITVTLAGSFLRIPDTGLAGSVVQTGAATFDDSLLSYTIFAQNDETRTIRIRRGFGDSDDLGVAACR